MLAVANKRKHKRSDNNNRNCYDNIWYFSPRQTLNIRLIWIINITASICVTKLLHISNSFQKTKQYAIFVLNFNGKLKCN